LINASGSYWYPIQLSANATLYACQIDMALCYNSSTGIPSGWSYPSSGLWTNITTLPAALYACQITIPSGMSSVLGFSVGSYPSTTNYTSAYSVTSNIIPQIHPISSYFLTCSLVSNPMNAMPNILTSFTSQGISTSQMINVQPNEFGWLSIPNQSVQSIRFTILDQLYNFVQLQDPQIVIELVIRERLSDS